MVFNIDTPYKAIFRKSWRTYQQRCKARYSWNIIYYCLVTFVAGGKYHFGRTYWQSTINAKDKMAANKMKWSEQQRGCHRQLRHLMLMATCSFRGIQPEDYILLIRTFKIVTIIIQNQSVLFMYFHPQPVKVHITYCTFISNQSHIIGNVCFPFQKEKKLNLSLSFFCSESCWNRWILPFIE